jgi:hypothetical protein
MPANSSGAERARRHRDRKRCGKVVIQDLVITRPGIGLLVARGWLYEKSSDDQAQVRAALVEMVYTTLNETLVTSGPPPFRQMLKSVLKAGLF